MVIYMGKITRQQEQFINEFRCERLTSNLENKSLIQNFENKRNESVASQLRENAWMEDCEGTNAYYVIKYHGEIVLYFSLQCGALFRPFDESKFEQELKKLKKPLHQFYIRKTVLKK